MVRNCAGVMRSAALYMRVRQLQKSSPPTAPLAQVSVSPAMARWKAWLWALTTPGSTAAPSTRACGHCSTGVWGATVHQWPLASACSSTPGCQRPCTQACGAQKLGTALEGEEVSGIQLLGGVQRGVQKGVQQRLHGGGALFVVGKGRALLHIEALAHFQLHGVDAVRGVAIVAGDVAALEAAI